MATYNFGRTQIETDENNRITNLDFGDIRNMRNDSEETAHSEKQGWDYFRFGDYCVIVTNGDCYVGDWNVEMGLIKNGTN